MQRLKGFPIIDFFTIQHGATFDGAWHSSRFLRNLGEKFAIPSRLSRFGPPLQRPGESLNQFFSNSANRATR